MVVLLAVSLGMIPRMSKLIVPPSCCAAKLHPYLQLSLILLILTRKSEGMLVSINISLPPLPAVQLGYVSIGSKACGRMSGATKKA